MMDSKGDHDPRPAEALELLLQKEVVPAYEADKNSPLRAVASADVFAAVRLHHTRRVKGNTR